MQNQEALRAGEIMKSFPHTYLERYLDIINDKKALLETLNFSDKRLEFDKLFYSIIGLFDKQVPFGSQDKAIKAYVFEKQGDLNGSAQKATDKMINNLNKISELKDYKNDFKPTKRYLKLLLLLCAFDSLDFNNAHQHLANLGSIDKKLAKFSSVAPKALELAFADFAYLIEDYRKFAELCVRTHNYDVVEERMMKLPQLVTQCPF
jgi:hypothetical protein